MVNIKALIRTSLSKSKAYTYYIEQSKNTGLRRIKIYDDICQISNLTNKTKITTIENLGKKIKKRGIKRVILSKGLHQNQDFINALDSQGITIFDGKWLIQYMILEIIQYLEKNRKLNLNDEVAILANDFTEEVGGNINKLITKFKKIRIITNHAEKFRKIEEKLYEEKGISIIITNNKKRALSKSELIINFDFVQEIINQYNIYENAYIINLDDKIKINKKRFNGTIITDYEVKMDLKKEKIEEQEHILDEIYISPEKFKNFYKKEILEEKIYEQIISMPPLKSGTYAKFENARKLIVKNKIEIENLYGINGKI